MKPGRIDITTDLGLTGDGFTDCFPVIQRALNQLTSPCEFFFSQGGLYRFSQGVIADNPSTWFTAFALGPVVIEPIYGKINSLFVFGLRQKESGNIVTSLNRPDCFTSGLDRSFVSAPSTLFGYRTLGSSYLLANAHPIQIGQRSPSIGDHVWDYWSELTQWTIEFAITPNQPFHPGDSLFNWGSPQFQPAPITINVDPSGTNQFLVTFKTSDMNPLWNTGVLQFRFGNTNVNKLTRVQLFGDFGPGVIGAIQDGQVAPIQWISPVPNLSGKRFYRNRTEFSFCTGASRDNQSPNGFAIPDFSTFGFRLSNIARKTDPGSDGKRYLDDPNTIAFFPGSGQPGRSFDISSGHAADSYVGNGFIIPVKIPGGGIKSGGLRNLVIKGGSPSVVNVGTLGLTIKDCDIQGYHQSIGNLPVMASYPIYISNCNLSGGDSSISFWKSSVYLNNNVIERGGITSQRYIGCNVHSYGTRLAFTTGGQETFCDMFMEEYGGTYTFDGDDVDSETDDALSVGVYRCETHPETQTVLVLNVCEVSKIGRMSYYAYLIGHAPQAGVYYPAQLIIRSPKIYTDIYAAVIYADVGWFGDLDARTIQGPKTVVGPAANSFKVATLNPNPINP